MNLESQKAFIELGKDLQKEETKKSIYSDNIKRLKEFMTVYDDERYNLDVYSPFDDILNNMRETFPEMIRNNKQIEVICKLIIYCKFMKYQKEKVKKDLENEKLRGDDLEEQYTCVINEMNDLEEKYKKTKRTIKFLEEDYNKKLKKLREDNNYIVVLQTVLILFLLFYVF